VRAVAACAGIALLLAGCASSGSVAPAGSGAEPTPAQLRQTVEDLGREVRDLRAQVEATRRVALGQRDLLGVRAEVEAVQAALQALIRDLEQRQLEAFQAMDRRLAAVSARLDELAGAPRRAETGARERSQPGGSGESPPPAPPPGPARPEPPAPAQTAAPPPPAPAEPAEASVGRGRTIHRVSPAEVAGETRVSVEADGPLSPRVFVLADPTRVILDFENAAFGFGRTPVEVDGPLLERIRFIQLRGAPTPVIRLVLGLKRSVPYWIEPQARGLVIHLGSTAPR